ncbi:carbohydrate kinase, partial [Lichenihabitans sp. Uapishka_5]|uniref:FGGY-family carbohydrate kinase n=1 Tax=Lichenihabitans sp. Uapishka_5 TaxID=3037302 RepID=UPI0029E80E1C
MTAAPHRIAVLDVGKTNAKLVLFADGREAWTRTMPNQVLQDGPYPHVDVTALQNFFVDALADLWRDGGFDAVSITAHGAAGALLRGSDLALPVLDYEYAGPDAVAADYDRVRPGFAESFAPRLPGGLNLGAQLFWQERRFPTAFAASTGFVTYPQFWAFWLTGVAATEPTSLGAHTDLWAPRDGCFSTMVETLGWASRLAPLRSAFDILGPIAPDLARRIGLDRPVPVACGIHDSNASLLPHLRRDGPPLAVVSTGTWVIAFALGGALDRLDLGRDTLANVDAYRRPVPSARFMGGREFDRLTDGIAATPDAAAIARVVGDAIMVLPSFAPGNGPFPRATGRWSHDPTTLTPAERTAAASLYAALMTATCLDLLGASGDTVIEGPFARNDLFCDALEGVLGRPVRAAGGGTGTSAGAAHLLGRNSSAPIMRARPGVRLGAGLKRYA